jgi:tRNA(adenine34) deaminase
MDPKLGACGSLYSIPTDTRTNHQVELLSGVCTDESKSLLQEFFRRQRAAGKK